MKILKWYEEREISKKEFYENKKYLSLIDDLVGVNLSNDDYENKWNYEIDEMFDFLFDNACNITSFEDEVFIQYNNKFISLFEIHGQGCFRRISEVKEKPLKYVEFDDIVRYYEFKQKPYKSYVSEIINRALDTLKVANNSDFITIGDVKIDINEVNKYIETLINQED